MIKEKLCPVIGVLKGEGIGPEIIDISMRVLDAVVRVSGKKIECRLGGLIGVEAKKEKGKSLPDETEKFVQEVFAAGGSLLCGPGGARFVYDLRSRFDLYYKLTPIKVMACLEDVKKISHPNLSSVDILMVRENTGGIYFGEGREGKSSSGERFAELSFRYRENEVKRILKVAQQLATERRGKVTVVLKKDAIKEITDLWIACMQDLSVGHAEVKWQFLDIDNACYQLISKPHDFDVVVSPNMLGDIMADLGATLLGSRGLSYSGNYSDKGNAVFQTGHGSAYDIAKLGIANPIGQILSLVMMLETSFGWIKEAKMIRDAVASVLKQGIRTQDIASKESRLVNTEEMGEIITREIEYLWA